MNAIKSSTAAKFTAFILCIACSWAMCVFALTGFSADFEYEFENPAADFLQYMKGLFPVSQAGAMLLALLFGVLAAGCFVFLLSASGHHDGTDGVSPSWGTRIPLELIIAFAAAAICCFAFFMIRAMDDMFNMNVGQLSDLSLLSIISLCCGAILTAFIGVCMSFSTRFKLGGWWKGTLCWMIGALLWRAAAFLTVKGWALVKYITGLAWKALKGAWGLLTGIVRGFFGGIGRLIKGIPLVMKGCIAVAALFFIQFCCIMAWRRDTDMLVWSLFLSYLAGGLILLYCMLCMKKLQNGATALANGDLGYKVDTKRMVLDFRSHGENLNRLAQGTNLAVEQRLKSERFKTELITNVSHDIKTPLTSIINYSELIGRETGRIAELKSETAGSGDADGRTPEELELLRNDSLNRISEYSDVLHRQSEKLKKLLEDLLEASKASTGNLDVYLDPCDAGIFISQTEGEYRERLENAGLNLVCSKPDHPVRIMADGRRMQRIFDNLMNNICKYSLPGSRVYLDLEEKDGKAVISFRNTSAQELNISSEELMERFVRGDQSRTTEGSGLGLSIARSLTELQKGCMDIIIDGDLFKVVLIFDTI